MPSIRDVAEMANVSIATVSRVITKSAPVEGTTRERVEAAISEIGYRPNITAQSLRSKSGQMVGLLVPGLGNPAFTGLIDALSRSAASRELGLIIADTYNDQEEEIKAIDMMLRRNVDGIILSRVSDKSHIVRQYVEQRKNRLPLVVVDRALAREGIPNVVVDNYKAGLLAGRHLISAGCRRIACAGGPRVISLVRDRNAGFEEALRGGGIALEESTIVEGDFSFESGMAAVDRLFGGNGDIDGLWCHDDIIALGALSALQKRGVRVPDDVALMGMDDIQYARMCHPSLTTIAQPYREMGETVLDLIDVMRNGKRPDLSHIVMDVELVERESTMR